MSGTDHKHPTFGVCTCGHMDFMHPWTEAERVDFQAGCLGVDITDDNVIHGRCQCERFHADKVSP